MKATRFMRIPFFVTGYAVTDDNMDEIAKWCEGYVIRDSPKPFVRVPVNRALKESQTRAYPGSWVIVSVQRGERSFKVYSEEWLRKQFLELPEEPEDVGIPDTENEEHTETLPNNVRPIPGQREVGLISQNIAVPKLR